MRRLTVALVSAAILGAGAGNKYRRRLLAPEPAMAEWEKAILYASVVVAETELIVFVALVEHWL